MAIDRKSILLLQTLGLTFYEAKAFSALTTTGSTTPFLLAEAAGIPRTKIYEVIRRLEEYKWVVVEKGRPGSVTPLCPREVINERKLALSADIDGMANEFTMRYEKRMDQESPKVNIIRGIENITMKTIEIMGRAKKDIYSFGSLYFPEDIEPIKMQVLSARRRNVNVRILTDRSIAFKDREIDLLKEFSQVVDEVRIAPLPFVRIVTIDDKEMLMVFSRSEDGLASSENTIAIWISNESIASYIDSTFKMDWEKYRSLQKKLRKR